MTDQYAVVGNPLSHTKSPLIHRAFAREQQQELEYSAIEAPLDGFAEAAQRFRAQGGRGINITAPFKLEAHALATELSPRARQAGAVNALKFEGDRILAENFDGVGLVKDVQHNLGFPLQGLRVLVLGAGGAARGALLPILASGPLQLTLANRTLDKAVVLRELCAEFGVVHPSSYEALEGQQFDIVLNATSASLRGESLPLPASVYAPGALAYELAYGKGLTPFLRYARQAGVKSLADGVGMLVEQAAEAFLWWRGVRPATAGMIAALTVPLA